MEDVFAGFIAVHYAVFLTICVLIAFIAGYDELVNKEQNERN